MFSSENEREGKGTTPGSRDSKDRPLGSATSMTGTADEESHSRDEPTSVQSFVRLAEEHHGSH